MAAPKKQKPHIASQKGKNQSAPASGTDSASGSGERNLGGRPPMQGLPHKFPSMTACHLQTGIPMEILRKEKARGNIGITGAVVNLEKFLRDYFHPRQQDLPGVSETGEAAPVMGAKMKEHYAGLREKQKYENEAKMLAPKQEIREGLSTAQNELFAALDRILLSELPPALVGHDEMGIRNRMSAEIDEVKVSFAKRMKELEAAGTLKDLGGDDDEDDAESDSAGSEG